jgi:CheY-like chemotaxis protein
MAPNSRVARAKLPIFPAKSPRLPPPFESLAPTMLNVLIIDDNRSVRLTLEYCIQHLGHTATLADDGPSGLALAAEAGIDVILLDVDMPLMNGFAVCRAIKSAPALRHLPVIMMTGCLNKDTASRAFAAGAAGFLSKPFSIEELQVAISRKEPANRAPASENSARSTPQAG